MKDIELKTLPTRPFILDLDREGLEQVIAEWGEPGYRVQQIWEGLYRHFWQSADQFGSLPHHLREKLAGNFDFRHLQPVTELKSTDLREKRYSSFPILAHRSGINEISNRRTLCISSQQDAPWVVSSALPDRWSVEQPVSRNNRASLILRS
jgi:adenine C2-methylase RlmN of 23S rRNA A2503 and tRNA A37